MSFPKAVGGIPPPGGWIPPEGPNDVLNLLKSMNESLAKLADRLAPEPILIPIQFSAVPAGMAIGTVNIPTGGFNGVLMCLTQGLVNLYFGGGPTAVPDMQFTGGANPIYIPLPPQTEHQVYVSVDAASTTTATGVLYLIQY
jgi:hypothetical protein